MMDGLLSLESTPLASLLNRSMARLGSPGLIGVVVISNKDIYVSISFIPFFHCSLYEFNSCFCLPAALVDV